MRRVPTLDSYMPMSSTFTGYDPQMEGLARKHIEVYRRKKSRSGSPTLVERNASGAVEDRMSKWEAEKGTISNNTQYVSARLEYLEDIIKLQRDTIERPLRREKADLESKIDTYQNQLNVVAGQMENQTKKLAEYRDLLEAAEDKSRAVDVSAKDERERLSNLHEKHLQAEQRANEAVLGRLNEELQRTKADLEVAHASVTSKPSSPLASRNPWREESAKLELLVEELSDTVRDRDKEIHSLTERIKILEGDSRVEDNSTEHKALLSAWDTLTRFITHADRQKAGIRTAVSQLQLTSVNRAPRKPKPVPAKPLPGDSVLKWAEAMSALASVASEEGNDSGSYSVSILLKVIEAHKESLEESARKEKEVLGSKGLERQRLVEIERDRDEERRMFQKERERLKAESNAFRRNLQELQRHNKLTTIDSDAQTDASLGILAETYTQTAWDGSDPALTRLTTDVEIKQAAITDLTRSMESRDSIIRSLREQRERFLSFIFESNEDPHHHSATSLPTHKSSRRPSQLAQLSTFDFVTH